MKIYLAGPDVFRTDALSWAEDARTLLAQHGHQALIPLDNDETRAEGIFKANIDQIMHADVLIAISIHFVALNRIQALASRSAVRSHWASA